LSFAKRYHLGRLTSTTRLKPIHTKWVEGLNCLKCHRELRYARETVDGGFFAICRDCGLVFRTESYDHFEKRMEIFAQKSGRPFEFKYPPRPGPFNPTER